MTEELSFFGKLDAATVEKAGEVLDGPHSGLIKRVRAVYSAEKDKHSTIWTFQVIDDTDESHMRRMDEWLQYYPNMTEEDRNSLDTKSRSIMDRNIKRLRNRLEQLKVDLNGDVPSEVSYIEDVAVDFTIYTSGTGFRSVTFRVK